MNLDSLVFKRIQDLIDEGKIQEASRQLLIIVKHNELPELQKEISALFRSIKLLNQYIKGDLIDRQFAGLEIIRLTEKAETALSKIMRVPDLKIPYGETVKVNLVFKNDKLTPKAKKLLFEKIARITGIDVRTLQTMVVNG